MYVSTNIRRLAQKSRSILVLGAMAFYGVFAASVLAQTQVTNTATVTVPSGVVDTNANNDTSSVQVNVVAPRLVMTKTASTASFTVGTAASYTLQVSNTGTSATTAAATVSDPVPAGLTIGTLPAGCTAAGQTVTCSVAAGLAAGSSTSFVIPVTPTAGVNGTTLTNTATVSGGGDSTCPANPRCSSTTTTPVVAPQLTLTKTASAASFTVGTAAGYTLQVRNTGTSATTATTTVSDTIPTGLTIGTLPAGCTAAGQTVTCTVATGLAVNATSSFVIPVTPTSAAAASVTNTATVSGGGDSTCPANARCTSAVTTPVSRPLLNMTKTAGSVSGPDGSGNYTATYTVTATNSGTAPGVYGVLTDNPIFSSNLVIVGATWTTSGAGAPVGGSEAGDGPYVLAPANTPLGAGATHTYNVSITFNFATNSIATACTGNPGDGLYNAAEWSSGTETDTNDNSACINAPLPPPQLTLTKTASATSFTAGVAASYTLAVQNTGRTATTAAATVTDTIPAGLTIGTLPAGCTVAGQTVTCTVATGLAVNATSSFVIPVTPTSAAAASVTNTATVSGGGDSTCPANARCTSTVTTPVTSSADVSIVKSAASPNPVRQGQLVTWTVTVSNAGPSDAAAVTTADAVPSVVTGVTVGGANAASCTVAGQDVTCNFGALANGATRTFTISGTLAATFTGSLVNTATVSSTTADPTPGNNSSTSSTPTAPNTVTAVDDSATTAQNTPVTTAVLGNDTTTGAPLNPASVTVTVNPVNGTTTVNADGTIRYTPNASFSGTDTYTYEVCDTSTPTRVCDTAVVTVTVLPGTEVTYSKSVILPTGQTEVSVGDTLTYNLQVTVADAATTSPVTLTDTLGQGLTLGTVTAGSFSCGAGNPLVCTLPANTVPGTYQVSYTATVNALATGFVRNVVVATGDDAPTCQGACRTETIVTEPLPAIVSYGKSAVLPAGKTRVVAGDVVTYTLTTTVAAAPTSSAVTLTDTPGAGLTFGAVTAAGAYTCNAASPLVCTLPVGTVPGVYTVTYTATVNGQASGVVRNAVVGTGTDNPVCANECSIETPVATPTVMVNKRSDPANGATVQPGQAIAYTLSVQVGQAALGSAVTLVDTPDRGLTLGTLPAGCTYNGATLTCIVPAGTPVGTQNFTYTATVNASATGRVANVVVASSADPSGPQPTCQSCSTEHQVGLPEIRLGKSAGAREVKVGDLVRYTLTVENVGRTDLVNGSIVDTPAAGFSYVEGSLVAADADQMATVSGNGPLRFAGVDVRAGETATLVYVLRVGAGVRPGVHVNQAQVRLATEEPVSNVATAEVTLTADATLDDSLLFGTVFNDRDGDGWQDSATLGDVKVQGGFASGAYVANSTTVDRGAGPQPEPDASSPMLHGIAVGTISGRQTSADPVEAHEVVIRQRLSELAFTDDFVLTSDQGVSVRMDAAGNTRIERSGDAAKGLTAAMPTVERRVAQGEGGYVVDYVIRNAGIDERGIPGVRIASVEGLLIETDQYGRYHLAGVSGGAWERGRNFILKVDPSTLPSGAEFTTDNPLLRRITPGVPARFDFGVKLPEQVIEGGSEQVELELGDVFFAPGSAEVRAQYQPVIEAMAAQVRKHGGGEVVISANGDAEALAFERANAVKAALLGTLDTTAAHGLVVSVRSQVDDPASLVVGVDEGGALLGTVLFDTDKATIRREFEPLLDKVAAALQKRGGGSIAIVGHTDVRGARDYNTALGMRRAKAVYEALAQRLDPEVRAKVRVESSGDPTAPVGVRK